MKNIILSLIFLSLLFSCDKESITPEQAAVKKEVSSSSSFRAKNNNIHTNWQIYDVTHNCDRSGPGINFSFALGGDPILDYNGINFYYRTAYTNDPFILMTNASGPILGTQMGSNYPNPVNIHFTPDPLSSNHCYEIIVQAGPPFSPIPEQIVIGENDFRDIYNFFSPITTQPKGLRICCFPGDGLGGDIKGEGNNSGHTVGG